MSFKIPQNSSPSSDAWKRRAGAVLFSLGFHGVVVLALGCLFHSGADMLRRWEAIETLASESTPLPALETIPSESPAVAIPTEAAEGVTAPGNAVGDGARSASPPRPHASQSYSLVDAMQISRWNGRLAEEVGEADLIADIGNGTGRGASQGMGAVSGGSFFGVMPPGPTVVYVVDASRSMNHPYPGDAKTRFRRLKLELINSIAAMPADMSFYVLFFNIDVVPMPASHPQRATPENKAKFSQWIAQAKADRETDPRRAMMMAMRMRPDVVYFLTDGDFDRPIERELQKIVQKQTVIHTFAFGKEAGRDSLRSLAKANGGKFYVIP